MKHVILCTVEPAFTDEGKAILDTIGHTQYVHPSQGELEEMVSDVTILVVQLGLNINKAIIDKAPHLQFIATATTGLDHIDKEYAESKGIQVVSLKDETEFLNTITSTAELALGLMISLVRQIPHATQSVLNNEWNREAFRGHSLYGKTLGVVGFGRLGKMMGKFGTALGMDVVFNDPNVSGGISLTELLQTSDVISIHVPLNTKTEAMIGAAELNLMKPNAVLINTARGKLVNESDLIEVLEQQAIAGYATDVLSDELSFVGNTIQSELVNYAKNHSNVLITPHIGGTTTESREATDVFLAKKLHKIVMTYTKDA